MEQKNKTYKVLNMCDFCANDCAVCKADRVFSGTVQVNSDAGSKESVIACDMYVNPIVSLLDFY